MSLQILPDDDELCFRQYYDPETALLCGPYELVDAERISGHAEERIASQSSLNVMDRFAEVTRVTRDMTVNFKNAFASILSPTPSPARTHALGLSYLSKDTNQTSLTYSPTFMNRAMSSSSRSLQNNLSLDQYDIVSRFELDDSEELLTDSKESSNSTHEISVSEWNLFFDNEVMIQDEWLIRSSISKRRLQNEVRKFAWPYLLKVHKWHASKDDRERGMSDIRSRYDSAVISWKTIIQKSSEDHFERLNNTQSLHTVILDSYHRIEKDIVRTDQSLPFYSSRHSNGISKLREILMTYIFLECQDIGYVQGMADFASIILMTMDGDVYTSYACFSKLMESRKYMFSSDGRAMQTELDTMKQVIRIVDPGLYLYFQKLDSLNCFFCFRWFLVLFRREFSLNCCREIFDMLFSSSLCRDMHFFVAMAILTTNREVILTRLHSFDDVLKYINSLSMRMDVRSILRMAEKLFLIFYRIVTEKELLDKFEPEDLTTISLSRVVTVMDSHDLNKHHH